MKVIDKQSILNILYTKGYFSVELDFVLNLVKSFNGKISTTHNNCIHVPHN